MRGRVHLKRAVLWSAVAGAWLAGPGAAGAQAETLVYSAPASCPDRDGWLAQVAARRNRATSAAELGELVARVAIAEAGTSARIQFRGDASERLISGRDCAEVSAAAALIVAIAGGDTPPASALTPLAPDGAAAVENPSPPQPLTAETRAVAGLPPRTAASAPSPSQPNTAAALSATALSATAASALVPSPVAASSPTTPAGVVAAPEPDAGAATGAEQVRGDRWRWAAGAGAELNSWLLPWPAALFDAALDARAPSGAWSARLGATFGFAQRRVNARVAEFRVWGARLDLCPLALARAPAWHWSVCGAAQLGLVRAWGDERSALAVSTPHTAPLAGLELRTRLQTPLLGPIRFEAEVGLGFPLLGQAFRFGAPAEEVFESPGVGVIGRAGIQVPFAGVLD
jgi:hypothetical protein